MASTFTRRAPGSAPGLTEAEAARRLAADGPNRVPEPHPPGLPARLAVQLRDPLSTVLLAALVVTIALRDTPDAVVIALVITVNTTVGMLQEMRADRAVAALQQLAPPSTLVVRAGTPRLIPAEELVPGDTVVLAAGDVVPADLVLVEAVGLRVDEAALTGESVAVDKAVGPGGEGELLAGTVVVAGRAAAQVTRTGAASALGRISALVSSLPRRRTPLERRLAGLGRLLALAALALSTLVVLAGLLRGRPLMDTVLTGVSLVVAAVPESLPAVVTVTLALGAHRMARRAAIVRRLPAVETLGSVTVLAADKTGTLTEGTMACEAIVTPQQTIPVAAAGGELSVAARVVVRDVVLCNDAQPARAAGKAWTGDPVEVALMRVAGELGVDAAQLRAAYPRVGEIPFDTARRQMISVHRAPDDSYLVVAKGAPETLLAGGPLTKAVDRLTREGFRVLAVAESRWPCRPAEAEWETALAPVGLVALRDPLRAAAADTVRRFRRAGVRLVLVTGDHPATATAVARRLGIADGSTTVTGDQLAAGTAPIDDVAVFARTRPDQKQDIVEAFKRRHHVVAMTGDGVNDAPALRAADIGVAMGRHGTEVARQAADLVLADDNLATVAAAIEEGRRIYTNIGRFLTYGLSGGMAEILVMLVGPFTGLAVPLLPGQILWVNMLTHGLPGVALGAEPADRGLMDRPPRPASGAILTCALARRILAGATLITIVCLAVGWWAAHAGRPWQTMVFVVLGSAQLGIALSIRSRRTNPDRRNRALAPAVGLSLGLLLLAVWLPPLRDLLELAQLTVPELAACLGAAAVPGLVFLVGLHLRSNGPRIGGPKGLSDRPRTVKAGDPGGRHRPEGEDSDDDWT